MIPLTYWRVDIRYGYSCGDGNGGPYGWTGDGFSYNVPNAELRKYEWSCVDRDDR